MRKSFSYNLKAIAADLKKQQKAGGIPAVTFSPIKPIVLPNQSKGSGGRRTAGAGR